MDSDEYREQLWAREDAHLKSVQALERELRHVAPLAMQLPHLSRSAIADATASDSSVLEVIHRLVIIEQHLRTAVRRTVHPTHVLLTGNIAAQIQAVRTERNLSQAEFAQQLDVSVRTVARWEAGHGTPRAVILQALGIGA